MANIPGKKVEHNGIKVQLLGQIELASERGHPSDFLALSKQLPASLLPPFVCDAVRGFALCSSLQTSRGSYDQAPLPSPHAIVCIPPTTGELCSEGPGASGRAQHAADLPGRVCKRGDAVRFPQRHSGPAQVSSCPACVLPMPVH